MNTRSVLAKDVLGAVALLGLVAIALRLFFGLGATTALSDAVPWGLWKILNMVAGVALATGGFTLACTVYVLGLEKYRALVRPALLLAFLGYGSSCFALLLDIGLPHRIWHPIFYWNHHSFLFEVAWCVMLYFSVTVFEMTPVILEKFPFPRLVHWLHRVTIPIVIVGITLSTLHHSSLGSLFLVTPTRLHELWYSPWLPILFFISAVGAGLMCVVLVTHLYGWLKDRPPKPEPLRGIAKAGAVALGLLFVVKLADITWRWAWPSLVSGSAESLLFLAEVVFLCVIPCVLMAIPKMRASTVGLVTSSASAVFGLVLNRLNVGIFGYFESAGVVYFPSLPEWALSIGIVAAGGLAFVVISERYSIFDGALEPEPEPGVCTAMHGTGPQPLWQMLSRRRLSHATFLPVIFIPLGVLLFWDDAARGYPTAEVRVMPPTAMDVRRNTLRIDGDVDGSFVVFDHARHQRDYRDEASCERCHHAFAPGDPQSACHRCHTGMFHGSSIFDHDLHAARIGARLDAGEPIDLSEQAPETAGQTVRTTGPLTVRSDGASALLENASCHHCHPAGEPKRGSTAKACTDCHGKDMGLTSEEELEAFTAHAPSYVEAMHGQCIACHEKEAGPKDNPHLPECATCHK